MTAIANLVHQISTSTGSGAFTLSSVNGRQAFDAAFPHGSTGGVANAFYYFISNRAAGEWEYGTGHLSSASVLVRDTVLGSSNSGSAVVFSGGTKDVTNALPAEYAVDRFGPLDVFLIGGQSNAQGSADDAGTYSPAVPTGKVLQYYGSAISNANDPVGNASSGSAWPMFGITWFASTGRRVLFVPAAVGGSSMSKVAQASPTWDVTGTSPLGVTAIASLNAALTAATAAGYAPQVRGVLWCQGEQDAGFIDATTETKAQYKAAFVALLAYLRGATIGGTTYPRLPVYLSLTGGPSAADTSGYQQVRAAQEEVAEADPYTYVAATTAVDFIDRGIMQTSSLHYHQAGYNEMGRLMAQAALSGQSNYGLQRWSNTAEYGWGSGDLYYTRGSITVGSAAQQTIANLNAYATSSLAALAAFGSAAAGSDNWIARLINTRANSVLDQRVGIRLQPAYGGLGDTYGGAIYAQQDQITGRTNLIFGGHSAGTFLEFGRWGYNGGLIVGPDGQNANGGTAFGPGSLVLSNNVGAGSDNNLLYLSNKNGSTADQRVGILLNPTNLGATYGRGIIVSQDGVTARGNLLFGGYSAGVWAEHMRLTYTGGLNLGGATDPGAGNMDVSGTYKIGGVSPTGSAGLVRATSPTLVTPLLGTPTSGNLANCTGYPASAVASGAALSKVDDTNVTLTLGGAPTTSLLAATSLTLGWTGQLGLTRGGTAASLTASNGGIVYSTASALAILSATATANLPLLSGASGAPSWAAVSHPTSATSGGVPYFSSTSVMASSALLTQYGIVYGGGAGAAPVATAAMSDGQLLVGQTSAAPLPKTLSGDATLSAAGALTLASTISAGGPTGSATVAAIITYDAKGRLTAVSSATITPAASSITGGQALSKTDDTNVTLALGGTPTTALLAATSLTLGWTGQLSVARGGTGLASGTSGGIPYFSSTTAIASSALLAANALMIGGGAGTAPSTTSTASGILTWIGTPSSANLRSALTDSTGTGVNVFDTAPTFTTSITSPKVIGGTGTGSTLTLQSTSGVGATDGIAFNVGNAGATNAMYINKNGRVSLGYQNTSDGGAVQLDIINNGGGGQMRFRYDTSGSGLLIAQVSSGGNVSINLQANARLSFATNNSDVFHMHGSGGATLGHTTDPGAGCMSLNSKLGVGSSTAPTHFIDIAAGTTAIAPIRMASGTNLTSAAAGCHEFDGVQFYKTIDTSSGRGAVPVEQYVHLTADGGTISTIANFFGATSNISLVASAYYIIDVYCWFLNTTAGTVTWTLTNSAAPTSQNIYYEMSPITGIVAPPGTATMLVGQYSKDATAALAFTTGTLTTAVDHYAHFKIWLQNGTGTSLKIQATKNVGGTITPRLNSYWVARRVSPNNIGTLAA